MRRRFRRESLFLPPPSMDDGIIKAMMGYPQFLLRGVEPVRGGWHLVYMP